MRGKKPNVTLVFVEGDGVETAFDILADIAIEKLKEKKLCEQRSMPE